MTITDNEARKILRVARFIALRTRPYFAQALCAISLREKPGIGTMACDAHWRVYYDPQTVRAWGPQNTAVGLLHEIGHLLHRHHARAKALGVTADSAREANLAQDAAINEHLLCGCSAGLALLATDTTPAKLGLPGGKLWEEYFAQLRQKQQGQQGQQGQGNGEGQSSQQGAEAQGQGQSQGQGQGQGQGGKGGQPGKGRSCGSGATGVREAWEDAPPSDDAGAQGEGSAPGLNEAEATAVIRGTAEAVKKHAAEHGRGSVAGWEGWAAETLAPPTVPWQRVLAGAVRAAVRHAAGAVDYTYSRPSRRSSAVASVVLPSLHRPIPEVALVLDTSGSMGDADVAAALAEINGVCKVVGAPVRAVTCDMVVHTDAAVQRAEQVKVKGRGGTDMRVGFRRILAERRKKPCNVIICLTDGDTPWPSRAEVPADVKVIVVMIGKFSRNAHAPSWMTTVRAD
jgi:predicted metal-dependent peptidase